MRAILTVLIFCMSISSFSQQSQYSQKWKEIEALELKGQVQTALQLVNEIRTASNGKTGTDYIKASIFRWKFLKITTEDAENTIIQELNAALQAATLVDTAILNTFKAGLLNDYFRENEYRNNSRSTGEIKTDDLTTWTPQELAQEITAAYTAALDNKQQLLATPVAQVQELLSPSIVMRAYKPTLYDIIAQEAMSFFKSPKYNIARPETLFEIDNPIIFQDSERFRAWNINTKDSLFSSYNAVKLLQDIEENHKNDSDQTAYIYAQLERLQFARAQFKGDQGTKLYKEGLLQLSQNLSQPKDGKQETTTTHLLIQYYLASYYVDQAPKGFSKDQDPVTLEYYNKARDICDAISKAAPNSEAAARATQLLKEIGLISLSIKTKKHSLPGVANRVWVQYRNVDSLNIKILKLTASQALQNNYRLPSEVFNRIISKDPEQLVTSQVCVLPESQDSNFHTVEYALPALDAGHYIIYADNGQLEQTKSYAHAQVEVSDFGYKKTDYDKKIVYQFYDRITGQPLVNLPVSSKGSSAAYTTQGETNTLGEYEIEKLRQSRKYRNGKIVVTAVSNKDTLAFNDNLYQYYENSSTQDNQAKAQLFLDRGIYRPGQPLYFKGILLQEINKVTQVTTGESVQLVILDANYEEIYRKEFTTNEYGSFSGEFVLPKEVLAGQFIAQIQAGTQRSDFWRENDNFQAAYAPFRVEEYKRPTFEINFDPVTIAYKPNDSIVISGNARAFLGSNVTGANGEYTIKRSKFNRYWYYYRNNSDEGRQLDAGTLTTDDKGNFEIRFKADFEEQSQDAIMQFTTELKITDLNGETQSGSLAVKVSKNNLYTTLTDPKQVSGGDEITLEIANKNLSDVAVSCENTLKIYKIQAPKRVMFERLWETPEHQKISEAAFTKAFPQEPYATDSIPNVRAAMVYEANTSNQAEYTLNIPTDTNWEAGEYEIEHIAQGKNNSQAITLQRFKVIQPKNTYLPADQLFSYEKLNENPKEDGFIKLRLKTSLKNLPVFVYGFYDGARFYAEKVDVNGNQTLTINLDKSYEQEAVIRVKYAQYDRFFSEDITVDLSAPLEFLQIEAKTFRSKLYPDSKEQWSFKITDQNSKKAQAEVLASMYDLSLDNFAPSYWSKDFSFRPAYLKRAPQLSNYTQYVESFRLQLNERRLRRYSYRFDRFYYFGLSLNSYDSSYQQYLSLLQQKRKSNNGNYGFGSIVGLVQEQNGPLPGATVQVKGTAISTQTDFDGQFAIYANQGDILIISFLGYETQEVEVGQSVIYTTLISDENLDEVIVTAQGVKREKRALGYAVTAVENEAVAIADDLSISSEADAVYVLSGKASGVDISENPKYKNSNSKNTNFKNVKIRKNLQETAFFYPHLTTNKKGEISINFDAPQLLTRWKFRLLAHAKNLTVALEEKEVVTQKDLSLVPNTPRFLREGDTVVLSAKIANLTTKAMQGSAQLQLFDASTMQPIDVALQNTQASQDFAADPQGNTSIFWKLQIPVGTQAVTYRMLAKAGKFSDGEENIVAVLPNRMMVTETVPFLVRAGQQKEVQMTHLLENTSSSLTHQQFTFEYTSNPAWYALQSLPYLMEFPHECAEQTFSRLYANSLSAKVLNSNPKIKEIFTQWKGDGVLTSALEKNEDLKSILIAETPWLRQAQSETERKKRLGLLFDLEKNAFAKAEALKKLKKIQNSDGGFPWFSGGKSSVYITRHIVAGFGRMQRLGIDVTPGKMLEDAIDYLDIEIENDLARYLKQGGKEEDFYTSRSHLHFLYARSFFEKEYPLLGKVKQIGEKAIIYYNNNWLEKPIYEKGLLALVNDRSANSRMATTILNGLRESAVQSEINGMYWKDNSAGWFWYQAPIETHALMIEGFDEVLDDQKTVEELKIWLLQQKRTGDWETTKATAAATYALLMSGTKFTDLDDSVRFTMPSSAAQKKLDIAPREQGTGYVQASWSKDEVSENVAQVNINNTGTTAGYGGLYWQYFEDLDKIEQAEEQVLNLNKKLFLVNEQDATATLEEISSDTALQLGQTVRVQLTIKTASNMEFVHLKDMRASGLEPIDVLSRHTYQDGISYYQSTRDVATHFFFDTLPLGTYVIEYEMRVNNKGSFSNGISTIQSMYAPEFSGNTAGMRVVVE